MFYILPIFFFSRNSSTGVVAIVQLLFGDPLQPLENGITDGKLGPLTVVNQLDINLSMSRCDIPFFRSAASTSDRK